MIREDVIYLTQTDTTVGFLSGSLEKLSKAKNRDKNQPFLLCVDSFKKQKQLTRTPKKFRSFVRRSRKTTFLYPNKKAIRVVKDKKHNQLLKRFDYLYSTSANAHKKAFSLEYAYEKADIMIEDRGGFVENAPSAMYKICRQKILLLRA